MRKSLTRCAGREYNGVSQGDTPLPPPGGGGGGADGVPRCLAHFVLSFVLVSENRHDLVLLRSDLRANLFDLSLTHVRVIETNEDVKNIVVAPVDIHTDLNLNTSDIAHDPPLATQPNQPSVVYCRCNHAKKVTQTSRIVNIFRSLFSLFLYEKS